LEALIVSVIALPVATELADSQPVEGDSEKFSVSVMTQLSLKFARFTPLEPCSVNVMLPPANEARAALGYTVSVSEWTFWLCDRALVVPKPPKDKVVAVLEYTLIALTLRVAEFSVHPVCGSEPLFYDIKPDTLPPLRKSVFVLDSDPD